MRELGINRWVAVAAAVAAALLLDLTPLPSRLAEPVRRAQTSFAGGRADAALESLEAAIEFEPSFSALHSLAARAALLAGRADSALEHLTAAGDTLPDDPMRRCLQGEALLILGDSTAAEQAWAAAGDACQEQPGILLLRSEAALASGDIETAIDALGRMAALDPTSAETQLRYGLVLATRDPDRAAGILLLAEELIPGEDLRAGAVRSGIESVLRFGDRAISLAAAGRSLGEIGEWELAALALEQALELDPRLIDARAYLGLALDQSGGDGLSQLRRAAAEAPGSPLPHFFLGLHWRARGDAEQALQELAAAAGLDPDNPSIAAEAGGAYEDLGEMDEALAAFLHAAELARSESGFWRLLAEFSTRNEIQVFAVGLPAARNAFALAPEDGAACDALGFAYFLAGDETLAQRFLHRAVGLDSSRPATQYHLGLLRLSQGDLGAARAAFGTAAALDPEGTVGELARRTLEGLPPE